MIALGETWKSLAGHVRSLVHAHAEIGSFDRDREEHAWSSSRCQLQAPTKEQLRCGQGGAGEVLQASESVCYLREAAVQ